MHILLIHQAFIGLDEAGGTRHIEIARHLADMGHRVTIIAGTTSYLTGVARRPKQHWKEVSHPFEGITLIHAWTYAALHRGFIQRLISFFSFMASSFLVGLGVRNVDAVWGTSPPIFQACTAWLLSFLKRKPFIFEVRDLWPAFAIAMSVLKNKLLIRMSLWLERFLYSHADQLIVNSPGFIKHIQNKGGEDIKLVPNGVDPSMFNTNLDTTEFRKVHHLSEKFVIAYAGAHGPSNDLGIILQAADKLQDQNEIHFLLVGDGKDKPGLQAEAKRLGLHNISFIPPVVKKDINLVLSSADVCIAILKPLELYKTTYPNKVFDYMASGRAVILAIDGVIRDVVELAQAGVYVQPGNACALADAVLHLFHHPEITLEMGQSGRAFVEMNFDRRRFSEYFESIATGLICGQPYR